MKVKPFGKNLKLEIVRMEGRPTDGEDFNELYLNHKEAVHEQRLQNARRIQPHGEGTCP